MVYNCTILRTADGEGGEYFVNYECRERKFNCKALFGGWNISGGWVQTKKRVFLIFTFCVIVANFPKWFEFANYRGFDRFLLNNFRVYVTFLSNRFARGRRTRRSFNIRNEMRLNPRINHYICCVSAWKIIQAVCLVVSGMTSKVALIWPYVSEKVETFPNQRTSWSVCPSLPPPCGDPFYLPTRY